MKDLNFFLSYKKKKAYSKFFYFYIVIISIITTTVFLIIANFIVLKKDNSKIHNLEKQLSGLESDENLTKQIELEKEAKKLESEIRELKIISEYIREEDTINSDLLLIIEKALPVDIALESITVDNDSIIIEGSSFDKNSIEEFRYELEQFNAFDFAFLQHISHKDISFDFTIIIEFKKEEGNELKYKNKT